MSAATRVAGTLLGAALTLGLVGLSRLPIDGVSDETAEVRLAWRFRSERVQQCRKLSAEELAKLPVHMRRAEECSRGLRPYLLGVTVDGDTLAPDTVRASGAREDRPLYVFRRIPVARGTHAVRVTFTPLGESTRAPLVLDTSVALESRGVGLVTLDTDRGVLVLRSAGR